MLFIKNDFSLAHENIYFILGIIFFVPVFVQEKQSQSPAKQVSEKTNQQIQGFPLPDVPAMLITPEQRSEFLANHFWDRYAFDDSLSRSQRPQITEQAWVDYLDLLNRVPLTVVQSALKKLMLKVATHGKGVFTHFTNLADKYLYDPNAPTRNEEFYIPVLEAMCETSVFTETDKIRPQGRLEMARKNRPGSKAIDFSYYTAEGMRGSLYGVKAEYTLLFINNPGCHACDEYIAAIKSSAVINTLLADGRLKILSVYPDEELDEWKRHLSDFPSEWINGYDKNATIKTRGTYDLKAIPTLYLLNKDKVVLLKDAPLGLIESFLDAR